MTYRIVNAETLKVHAESDYYAHACAFAKHLSDVHNVAMHVVSDSALHISFFPTIHLSEA